MAEEIAERRSLKLHPTAIWDIIHRQAGTMSKAVLEGVMNSVDAGASHCDLTIDRETFSISDDGKGFASDEEIENYFETFCYPHKEGDARYGRYRMGRGQIMAFGRSYWETNNYRMDVDLKPQKDQNGNDFALGYDFKKVRQRVKGCSVKVQLYEKLSPSGLDATIREIQDFVKYVDIPVRLNGKVISVDPAQQKWDAEIKDAWIKRKASGSLDVYNQGALVCRIPSYRYGLSGVVVSKQALEVNFARNDIQSSCPRWKRIVQVLRNEAMDDVKRNKPLDDAKREFLARELASGDKRLVEMGEARIVTDVTGSHHPFSIFERLKTFQNKVCIASRGDRLAERVHTRRMAFVVTQECAERFNASTPQELVAAIKEIQYRNRARKTEIFPVDRDDFKKVISEDHEPMADKELNKAERLALKALRKGSERLHQAGRWLDIRQRSDVFLKGKDHGVRRISVGVSGVAAAWTNGTSEIWFERDQLRLVKEGHRGMLRLASLMLHEYLHNEPSTGTHEHGVEFYNRFHDLCVHSDIVSQCADEMLTTVLKELRDTNQVVAQQYTRFEDKVVKAADLGIGTYGMETEPATQPQEEPFVPDVAALARQERDEPSTEQGGKAEKVVRRLKKEPTEDRQMKMGF